MFCWHILNVYWPTFSNDYVIIRSRDYNFCSLKHWIFRYKLYIKLWKTKNRGHFYLRKTRFLHRKAVYQSVWKPLRDVIQYSAVPQNIFNRLQFLASKKHFLPTIYRRLVGLLRIFIENRFHKIVFSFQAKYCKVLFSIPIRKQCALRSSLNFYFHCASIFHWSMKKFEFIGEVDWNFRNEFPENFRSIRFCTGISGNFGRTERAPGLLETIMLKRVGLGTRTIFDTGICFVPRPFLMTDKVTYGWPSVLKL